MSLEKPCGSRQQVLEQQEPWYQYHLNSVGSPILFNQACVSAVGGSLQQGGLAWQMLSEATFKAAALNQLYPCKGLLCHWALPEQQSEASEAFRFHQGCPCQSPSPTRWRCLPEPPRPPHLRVPLCWLHPAEHGQDKGSRFTSTRLRLGNQVLRAGPRRNRDEDNIG